MSLKDREKKRLASIKTELFSGDAAVSGTYRNKVYDFCLADDYSAENIYKGFRDGAIAYFRDRNIVWHDGKEGRTLPSNHLCCSQSACVNVLYHFMDNPYELKGVLEKLGFNVAEVLPILDDGYSSKGYIGFEWIGYRNYLKELERGKSAPDERRSRGRNFTSADFIVRFRQADGAVRIVIGEWKYTEFYTNGKSIQFSSRGTDRLKIYRHALDSDRLQIRTDLVDPHALMYDPFDQLMRLQLLAGEMERHREMEADIVSVLHIMPKSNKELDRRITSPALREFGSTIHEVWDALTVDDRFRGVYVEDLIEIIDKVSSDRRWADYIRLRYMGR